MHSPSPSTSGEDMLATKGIKKLKKLLEAEKGWWGKSLGATLSGLPWFPFQFCGWPPNTNSSKRWYKWTGAQPHVLLIWWGLAAQTRFRIFLWRRWRDRYGHIPLTYLGMVTRNFQLIVSQFLIVFLFKLAFPQYLSDHWLGNAQLTFTNWCELLGLVIHWWTMNGNQKSQKSIKNSIRISLPHVHWEYRSYFRYLMRCRRFWRAAHCGGKIKSA